MSNLKRAIAQALLILGVALVFLGLINALGVTPRNLLVSLVAIGAVLYAGAVWFGVPHPRSHAISTVGHGCPIVFDTRSRLVSGPKAGEPVARQFPEAARREIELHCAAALAGRSARFPCTWEGKSIVLDALPVRDGAGAIVYGLLIPAGARSGSAAEERAIHMVG